MEMKKNSLKIIVRKAKVKDLPQVILLLKGIAQYHHNLDPIYSPGSKIPKDVLKRLSQLIGARKRVLVIAEYNKKIIAYFVADIRKTRMRIYNKIGYISDGYVEKKYKGKGIGRSIFNLVKEWFLKRGIKRIELMVDTKNNSGIKAWQSYGFKEYQKKMQIEI